MFKKSVFDYYSPNQATMVAAEFDKLWAKHPDEDFVVGNYDNGREQGITIASEVTKHQVSIAEYRSSDDILVTFGTSDQFDEDGIIAEECWKSQKKFFQYRNYSGAAVFAWAWLTTKDFGHITK